ncbi:MAG: hypothetical protein GFH25_541324n31 [Chloroflexi bacterium AL-N10]|nr:hypothetical protein [Chloroflexi bacterium AL-N10]
MVTVYVWRPVEHEMSDPRAFDRPYTSTTDWQRSVGHASLLLRQRNGRETYLSFWPGTLKVLTNAIKNPTIKQFIDESAAFIQSSIGVKGKFEENYEADKKALNPHQEDYAPGASSFLRSLSERDADVAIDLAFLNEEAMYDAIIALKENKPTYNLFTQNCSTMVTAVLQTGAHEVQPDHIADAKVFAARAWDVLKTTAVVGGTFQVARQGYILPNTVNDVFRKTKMSATKPVFSFVEIIGGQTPRSVEIYAQRLKAFGENWS